MAEYDNINNGVAFPPFEDMKMILQGKMNVEGRDSKYAVVSRQTRDGRSIMEVYEKVGVMFKNDNTKDGAPDYSGTMYNVQDKTAPWTDPHVNRRVAAWRRQKDGKPYMSFEVSEIRGKKGSTVPSQLQDDNIPF